MGSTNCPKRPDHDHRIIQSSLARCRPNDHLIWVIIILCLPHLPVFPPNTYLIVLNKMEAFQNIYTKGTEPGALRELCMSPWDQEPAKIIRKILCLAVCVHVGVCNDWVHSFHHILKHPGPSRILTDERLGQGLGILMYCIHFKFNTQFRVTLNPSSQLLLNNAQSACCQSMQAFLAVITNY